MAEKIFRQYEVSVWSLNDEFITVLSNSNNRNKGSIQNPVMNLNVDGTQEFTFSIPMYYNVNGVKYKNPTWDIIKNEESIVNTRKIKVILNKKTKEEEIYEFAINKVTQRHETDQLFYDVECTGLAFYELGKIGYKISLSSQTFYDEDLEWFNNGMQTEEPIANIQYWLNQFLPAFVEDSKLSIIDLGLIDYAILDNIGGRSAIKIHGKSNINQVSSSIERDSTQWYYYVQMNWNKMLPSSKVINISNCIYEEQAYNADGTINLQEKARMVDLEESNIYNLTQDIAQIFSVYCKYVYSHDENYHIIGRTIVFYNNFLDNNDLSITYRGETQSITKELDSADLITKMYVRTTNDDNSVSIIDAEENDSGEDFLLDFDYLYSINNVSKIGYDYIPTYKEKLQNLNLKLKVASEQQISIENKIPEAKARKANAEEAITLDQQNIDNSNKMLNELTDGTGELEITAARPDSAALVKQGNAGDNYYYINIHRHGVIAGTIKLYRSLNTGAAEIQDRLLDEIKTAIPVFDEYNNLIQMKNIYWNEGSKIIYLTYSYKPEMYYENITNMWLTRLYQDTETLNKVSEELLTLESQLEEVKNRITTLLEEKKEVNTYFARLMGPSLREGYWQPENYIDRGNTFTASYDLSLADKIVGGTKYDTFLWDENLFEGEQDLSYSFGVLQENKYYPCINLSNIWNKIRTRLDKYSFIFNDNPNIANIATDAERRDNTNSLRILGFGSEAKLIFIKTNGNIIPALLLTGAENYSEDTIARMRTNGIIGILDTVIDGSSITFNINQNSKLDWNVDLSFLTLNSNFKAVYPRIRIESSYLKDDDSSLSIRYAGASFEKYTDYYINTRADESEHIEYTDEEEQVRPLINSNYITLKPESVMRASNKKDKLEIFFVLSDAASYIYKDAQLVIKENSRPRVSYSLNLDVIKNNLIKQPSTFLSRIVRINDYELNFKNVLGYVSGVRLDLDRPWQDEIEIQNYKTKYEDLFATIVAQTEEMKKTSYIAEAVYSAFNTDGSLRSTALQSTLNRVDLNYAFNNGKLTIDETNGIWGRSDNGVVAYRGGGIFTATQQDSSGNWIWNTGITPEGINATLLTSGQLDTSKVQIYAGDRIRFQLNEEGLFGYKSFFEDFNIFYDTAYVGKDETSRANIINKITSQGDIDASQFIRINENGLFLVAKENAFILNESKNDYIILTRTYKDDNGRTQERLDEDLELKRVSITWDGLRLKNLKGDSVFFADADTGDLKIKGSVYADAFYVITGKDEQEVSYDIATFINDTSLTELETRLKNNTDVGGRIKSYINAVATTIGGRYIKAVDEAAQGYSQGAVNPTTANINDIFYNTIEHATYICVATSGSSMWEKVEIEDGDNAKMLINSSEGTINFRTTNSISLSAIDINNSASSILNISTEGITMSSNKNVIINGGKVSIGSAKVDGVTTLGSVEITSGGTFSAIGNSFWIGAVDYSDWINKNDSQRNAIGASFIYGYKGPDSKYHLELGTENLRILSSGSLTLESGSAIDINAVGKITLMSGNDAAIELSEEGIKLASNKKLIINTNNFKLRPDLVISQTSSSNPYFYMGDNNGSDNYIRYSSINGLEISGTLTLGGSNNTDGKIIMKDSNNITYGEWNNNSLSITCNDNTTMDLYSDGITFSYGSDSYYISPAVTVGSSHLSMSIGDHYSDITFGYGGLSLMAYNRVIKLWCNSIFVQNQSISGYGRTVSISGIGQFCNGLLVDTNYNSGPEIDL